MIDRKIVPVNISRLASTVLPKPSRRGQWGWAILLAFLLGGLSAAALQALPGRRNAEPVAPTIDARAREVRLGSRVGGRVATVHVQAGQRVEPGQALVSFEAQELTARRDQAQ